MNCSDIFFYMSLPFLTSCVLMPSSLSSSLLSPLPFLSIPLVSFTPEKPIGNDMKDVGKKLLKGAVLLDSSPPSFSVSRWQAD